MARERQDLARRIAQDIERGWSVNLGIGIPTLVAQFIQHPETLVQSENGILGMGGPPPPGQEDPDLVDAGKRPASIVPGGCFFDSLMSFGLIRGGHLDLAVLGAFQVGANGDIANWRLPHKTTGALGGAADLAAGARQVWVAMEHVGKNGERRLLADCSYPLTARGVVRRIYTDLAVLTPLGQGRFGLVELADGVGFADVQDLTDAELVPAGDAATTWTGEHAHA
ncbi:MAG: 3-oxoadipate CoA-transferase, beta subunit [Blastococcus sp.]|jgi:3-oxoadipate CoA-transferase beta subunit|nr:3-oxoadipate CoA-transferase, beta subunit [Blastococcus sp.]